MGFTYHFTFHAPAGTAAAALEDFLRGVEREALGMGFKPTLVLNVPFDTKPRQDFARRLTTGLKLESNNLKGVVVLREGQIWGHDPINGICFVIPEHGVLLTMTDENGCETVFGFLRYPATLKDLNGRDIVPTGVGEEWVFRDLIKSPDPRYRLIVRHFTDAGYTGSEVDEFK